MILSAQSIRALKPLQPFHERTTAHGLTFGISPAGYDVRIAEDLLMWPGRFVKASTVEAFDMPATVLAHVTDKSTWARRGLCVQNTVIEPGWRGFLTLELTMHAWSFLRIKAGMPIAQILFLSLDMPTEQPYCGKYQDQLAGSQPAILEQQP